MLEGAPDTGADVIVFDLEDGVAPDQKASARATVRSVLADDSFDPDAECLVRVNPIGGGSVTASREGDEAEEAKVETEKGREMVAKRECAYVADVRALAPVSDAVDGVVLPKVRSGSDVRRIGGELRSHGLPRTVFALVETAAGIQQAPAIAEAGATDALVIGTEDLAADVGSSPADDRRESSYARQRVVTAAAAAGVDAIDTLWTSFEDEDGLKSDATDAVALGFDGKLAIHPAQVPILNEAFTPSAEQRDWAGRVLAAREEADGQGAFAVDGEMIDAPLIARAERIVDRARAAGLSVSISTDAE